MKKRVFCRVRAETWSAWSGWIGAFAARYGETPRFCLDDVDDDNDDDDDADIDDDDDNDDDDDSTPGLRFFLPLLASPSRPWHVPRAMESSIQVRRMPYEHDRPALLHLWQMGRCSARVSETRQSTSFARYDIQRANTHHRI